MAKQSTRKKPTRKRRSFFEPESKVLADWLAEQNDLGVSLQLIIVDAIRNYGDGDVIQAFLKARETVPGDVPITKSTEDTDAVKQVSVFAEAAPKVEAKSKAAAKPAATPKPEPEPELPVDDLPADPKPQALPVTIEEEVDPLDVMFKDIGSSMGR